MKQYLFALVIALIVLIRPAAADTTVDLGVKNEAFGSAGQARAILSLIEQQPNHGKYQATYRTGTDIVIFGVDMGRNTIARLHQRSDGHGTAERWADHSIYRLKAAASGGSLNDTPGGKSPGSMDRF